MAIVKFGVTVVGVRGTVGGLTFSENKAGPFVKQWAKGSNPKTQLQTSQRSLLAQMPSAWRDLSNAERAAWDTFAALPAQDLINPLGETYSISGFGWFAKINIRLLAVGRPIRDPVPVQARPSAPAITDLEFPFLDGETAFVQYASGEFDPDFDLILQVAQAASVGRSAPPSGFAEYVTTQGPNDTETSFAIPYVNRLGLGNPSLKGFLRLYRQTTDGLRSSAGSAAFVAADSSPYQPAALDYDAINDYAIRGADMTGMTDTKTYTIAAWFKIDGGNGSFRVIHSNSANRYELRMTSGNVLQFRASNSSGATIVDIVSLPTYTAGSGWHSVLFSVDTASSTVNFWVDNALIAFAVNTLASGETIDYTRPDHAVAARVDGSLPWDGCLSSLWFSELAAIDFSDIAIRRTFLSPDGNPLNLGLAGQLPTGAPPIFYAPGGDASNNVGGGGNFSNQGASNACADAP